MNNTKGKWVLVTNNKNMFPYLIVLQYHDSKKKRYAKVEKPNGDRFKVELGWLLFNYKREEL